jgi:hypothetical protein
MGCKPVVPLSSSNPCSRLLFPAVCSFIYGEVEPFSSPLFRQLLTFYGFWVETKIPISRQFAAGGPRIRIEFLDAFYCNDIQGNGGKTVPVIGLERSYMFSPSWTITIVSFCSQ